MENLTIWLVGQSAAVVVLGIGCYALWRKNERLTEIIIQMTKDSTNAANSVANKLEDTIDFLKKHSQ